MSDGKSGPFYVLAVCAIAALTACGRPADEAVPAAVESQAVETAADLPTLLERARSALATGQATQATNFARQGLALDSTHAELNNLLATALAIQGQNGDAIEAAQRSLRHHPDYALAHLNLGGIYFRLQQFEDAETHLLRAVELDSNQPSLHRRLADLYRTTQRPEKAVESIRRASELLPQEAAFAYLLGVSLEQAGAVAQAVEAYQRATELDPSMVEAWERIRVVGDQIDTELVATASASLEKFQDLDPQIAAQFGQLRRAILSSPEDPANHYHLGAFLLTQSLWEPALNKLQRTTHLQPDDARLFNHIGGLLTRSEQLDDALPFYLQAADIDPKDATSLLNAGSLFAMQGKTEQALPLYKRALERAPENPQVHYYYGITLHSAGMPEEARRILEAGLELAGDSQITEMIQKSLNTIPGDG